MGAVTSHVTGPLIAQVTFENGIFEIHIENGVEILDSILVSNCEIRMTGDEKDKSLTISFVPITDEQQEETGKPVNPLNRYSKTKM